MPGEADFKSFGENKLGPFAFDTFSLSNSSFTSVSFNSSADDTPVFLSLCKPLAFFNYICNYSEQLLNRKNLSDSMIHEQYLMV